VVLSTAYLAYLGPARGVTLGAEPVTAFEPKAYQRLDLLIRVSSKIATRRSGFLRASVVSLGVGLAYIVLPFVSWPSSTSATSQTLPTAPDWPTPAAGIPDALNAIRYEAEVAEIAATRAAAAVPDPESELPTLLGGAAAGLAVVVLVPMLFRPEADTARRRPDTPDPLAATADAT
jgi:hypothetical protein